MSTIYDMASGRSESPPAESNTADRRDELIPSLAVRELPSSHAGAQSQAGAIHLVRALLRKS
jgi:hypothetical protein